MSDYYSSPDSAKSVATAFSAGLEVIAAVEPDVAAAISGGSTTSGGSSS